MRIYLSVDLEGVNGIVHSSQTQPGEPGYERAVGLMHEETNAVIEGLVKAGAKNILVNDSHWDARNLRIEKLAAHASLINGWQKPFSMVCGINDVEEKVEAACFIGYHARAGHQTGVLSHTYRAKVFSEIQLNNAPVGELGLNAALAGHFGIPVMLVSGDDTLCQEANELLGLKVTCVQVKKAISRYAAICPPFSETLALLKEGAQHALAEKTFSLVKPPSPSTLKITFFDSSMADAAELIPVVKRLNATQVEVSHADYSVLFRLMLAVGVLGASRRDDHF